MRAIYNQIPKLLCHFDVQFHNWRRIDQKNWDHYEDNEGTNDTSTHTHTQIADINVIDLYVTIRVILNRKAFFK